MDRIWILGASDPEMQEIEKLLRDAEEKFGYAVADGARVHPGNAGRATDTMWPESENTGPAWGSVTHLVECRCAPLACIPSSITIIDHHNPGDDGFGISPDEFFRGSSLGQVIEELARLQKIPGSFGYSAAYNCDAAKWWGVGVSPFGGLAILERYNGGYVWRDLPNNMKYAMAADHCLLAAYRGKCPGIDPDKLKNWRAESRAKFQKRPVSEILADIESAREKLRHAAEIERDVQSLDSIHDVLLVDLTGSFIPELPEAACIEGIAVLAGPLSCPDGREKVVLQAASAAVIEDFLADKICKKLDNKYGDPVRGFAGGYLTYD